LLNRFDDAQQTLSQALQIAPSQGDILANLVSAALRACDWDALESLLPRLLPAV